MKTFNDVDIARYAVQVKHLPIDERVETLQRRLTVNMLKIWRPDPVTGKSAFLKARVLGDYNYLYKMHTELEWNEAKLENIIERKHRGEET